MVIIVIVLNKSNLILKYNPSHNFTDDLLKLLKINGHPELPYTCRTLLGTRKHNKLSLISNVKYVYLNVKKI